MKVRMSQLFFCASEYVLWLPFHISIRGLWKNPYHRTDRETPPKRLLVKLSSNGFQICFLSMTEYVYVDVYVEVVM